jgi:DNA modification methylase
MTGRMRSVPTIIVGDCLQAMDLLGDESIDAVVTDPPYGIGFMGKEWDTFKPDAVPSVTANREPDSDNPNLRGRKRAPAASPSGVSYDESLPGHRRFQEWTERWAREAFRMLKPGGHILAFGAPRSYHRMACGIEDAGFEVRDSILWLFGQGFPKSHNLKGEWQGWGTALKPGYEPVILARKPLIGTVAQNVTAYGTGALNIDGCRIEGIPWTAHDATGLVAEKFFTKGETPIIHKEPHALGRWPANVMHDGSEEVIGAFPDAPGQQGDLVGHSKGRKSKGIYGDMPAARDALKRGDRGSAARFFYCAKTSKADRNEGLDEFPERVVDVLAQHRSRRMAEIKRPDGATPAVGRNNHPTVKPTALMRYLCRLVTPPGGLILDPFMGSGSTGKAALLEGFRFIGIEREADYAAIARARIAVAA